MKTILALTIFLAASLSYAKAKDCSNTDQYTNVKTEELKKLIASNKATFIDVNSQDSYKKSHIPKAIHYASNKDKLKSVLPKNKDALIVAYCGGESCTAWQRAAKQACELNYTNIRHFKPGIQGWNKIKKG